MMKRVIALAALLAAFLPGYSLAQPQMPQPLPAEALIDPVDPEKARWLESHVVADGAVSGDMQFDFPRSLYRSRLILVGESHGFAAPQTFDLKLLTHLNERNGVRDYLAEVDPVQAIYLNRYLESGNEAVLVRIFDYWQVSGAQWGNRAFQDKVRSIRTLNQRLPVNRRIRFVGIDTIQDWSLTGTWVTGAGIDEPRVLDAAATRQRAGELLAALGRRRGEDVALLRGTLEDIAASLDRETILFKNYTRAIRSAVLGNRPAYGLWGMFHVMQGGINGAQPFAARITSSALPAAGRVTSIVLLPLDSAMHVPVPVAPGRVQRMRLTNFNVDGPFIMLKGAATLRAASKPGRITVFNPEGPGSPISTQDFSSIKTSVGENFIPDKRAPNAPPFAQYIGVFRNSDWAPPLSK